MALCPTWAYSSQVRLLGLAFLFCCSSSLFGEGIALSKIQQSQEYQVAKKYIADFLPDLAITRIEKILTREDLDETARATLLTLLGETQIRAGAPGIAIKTLDNPLLREFSPAHLWRSY